MGSLLLVALSTGLATGLGALPFLFRPELPRRTYDLVLGTGAGLMISAATLGLMSAAIERAHGPHGVDFGTLAQVLVGFAAGAGALMTMDRVIPHRHAGGHHEHLAGEHHHDHSEHHHAGDERQGLLVLGAMTIHRIPEGFAIGAGFAADDAHTHALGWTLAAAVAFQNLCEGAVMTAPLRRAGWSRLRALATVSATGLAIPVAALVGYTAAAQLTGALPFSLAFAAGALIYLISNEIIPETHSHGNERIATLGLIAGFLVTVCVQALGHTH